MAKGKSGLSVYYKVSKSKRISTDNGKIKKKVGKSVIPRPTGYNTRNDSQLAVLEVQKFYMVPAQEFVLFPNLPAEIRAKIWRRIMPDARHVNLNVGICNLSRKCGTVIIPQKSPYPVTMRINRESRIETFNACVIMYPEDYQSISLDHRAAFRAEAHSHDLTRTLLFRPDIDSLYFHTKFMYDSDDAELFLAFLQKISASHPKAFDLIEVLEIRGVAWSGKMLEQFHNQIYMHKMAALFKGLKMLCLTDLTNHHPDIDLDRFEEKKLEVQEALINFLEFHKICFNNGVIPKVVIRERKPVDKDAMEFL